MRELPVAPIRRKATVLPVAPNQWHFAPSRAHRRGASRSSRTLSAGCDGRIDVARRAISMRTAKSCGPDTPRQVSSWRFASRRRRRQESQVSGESTNETVKTIAQGMPVIRLHLWRLRSCALSKSHARLWVLAEAPGIPCALCFRGTFVQRSGRDARRGNGEPCMHPHPAHRSLRSRSATLPARGRDQAAAVSPIPPPRSAGRVGERRSALALRASRGGGKGGQRRRCAARTRGRLTKARWLIIR
jgi:hypothetical protein